jgi:hypothetical protein
MIAPSTAAPMMIEASPDAVASRLHKVIVLASVGIVGSHLSGPAPGRFIVARESQPQSE